MSSSPNPLLSIVVPVYNVSLYLEQCLKSLMHQGLSLQEFEVLMINDGSTDGSEVIAHKWARSYKNFILVNQKNQGLSAARNRGLDAAQGEFLVFVDSDDIIPSGTYRKMLNILQKSGSDFITSPAYRFGAWRRVAWPFAGSFDLYSNTKTKLTFNNHPEFIRDFTAWNKIYRKKFFINSGVRFPEGKIYEDIATSPILYHKSASFDVYAEPGYFWRITPGSITQTIKPVKALDRISALNFLIDYFEGQKTSSHIKEALDFAIIDYNLRWIFLDYHAFDQEAQREILKQLGDLTSRLSTEAISKTIAPIYDWVYLARSNKLDILHNALKCRPELGPEHGIEDAPLKKIHRHMKNKANHLKRYARRRRFTAKRRFKHIFIYLFFQPLVRLLPLDENRVVVSSYWGTKFSLSDGPSAMAVALAQHNSHLKIRIFTSEAKRSEISERAKDLFPANTPVRCVRNDSLAFYYNIWRAKYFFNDVNFSIGFKKDKFVSKRQGQIEVQTTHGVPLKKIGLDSEVAIHPNDVPKLLAKSKRYDYLVSTSPLIAKTFSKSHGVTPVILETGLPQNDQLFEKQSDFAIQAMKRKLGLDTNKKIIVYTPTFRYGKGYAFRFLIDFAKLYDQLKSDYQVIVKIHHYNHTHLSLTDFQELTDFAKASNSIPFIKLFGEVRKDENYCPVSVSQEEIEKSVSEKFKIDADINDLMHVADVLITDYSSIVFSYAHLDKPLILFTPDSKDYANTRGFYFNVDDIAPGAVVKSNEKLLEAIQLASDKDKWKAQYNDRIRAFHEQFLIWENGGAAKKIISALNIPASTN